MHTGGTIASKVDYKTGAVHAQFTPEDLAKGMEVELEHGAFDAETDVTGDDPILTAKIAWAHLKELPDYYDRLEKIESGS